MSWKERAGRRGSPTLRLADDPGEEDRVRLCLFRNRHEAETAHLRGTRALFALHFRKELKHLKKQTALTGDLKNWAGYFGGERPVEQALRERAMHKLLSGPVRTEREFKSRIEAASRTILLKGAEAVQEIAPAFKAYAEMRQWLARLEQSNRSAKAASEFIGEIRREMDRLLPPTFIAEYDNERLAHVPRYLKALRIRAERGILHLEKDREKAAEVKAYDERLRKVKAGLTPEATPEKRKAVAEFGWMLEEFRVAVFAQEVRTAFPVSVKRLDEKLRRLDSDEFKSKAFGAICR